MLLLLTLVFSFLTAAVIYSVSSAQVLQDTRCELYGAWQYLRLSDTAADAAQAQNTLPASAQVSTVIQNGIVLGADDGVAGGIGTADDTFAQLGRIVPISGNFPTQPDEIAMTTTLLDALGCSYDVGQTVTLKVAANDYDPLAGSGAVMEKAYTLCGVLPAYDVYWNLNGNLTVSGIVTEPLALDGQKFQTFYYLNAAAPVTASTDPALVTNEYAYPQEDTVSFSLRFLLVAAILVSFFAVAQYFLIVLHKRVHTINTFLTLGAKNRDLRLMCLWEALLPGLRQLLQGLHWLWRRGRRSGAAEAPFVLGDPRCISCAAGGAVSALRTAGRTFACGAGSPADRKTQREACKKIPLGTAAACTADRCRLRGIADCRQLSVCRLACHAAV